MNIQYPYMPSNGEIKYVSLDNLYMREAKGVAEKESLDNTVPTGAVIVLAGEIIGRGANGSNHHKEFGCERVRLGIPTGQKYELCEGCHPKNHAEPRAIANALKSHQSIAGAELYLWGHWWCCEPCWNSMLGAGINTAYLLEGSETLFNKPRQPRE